MRNGTISAELERACSQEPIHLLGTVQPHGFLMAVDIDSGRIVQVSSGIARHWPGLAEPPTLLGAPLFDWVERRAPRETLALAALPPSQPMALPWRARFERTAADQAPLDSAEWECLGHRSGDVAVLEWLPQATTADQLRLQSRTISDIAAVIARLRQADKMNSFPRRMRANRPGLHRLRPGDDLSLPARRQRRSGGRTNVVRLDPPKFIGLRFPATDIPAQARALYLTNRLRVLADVEAQPDTLVPPTLAAGVPLDQSHCMLRGLSPVHLSYLRNMGVRATLTMSIVIDGKLWGLIACHHHAPKVPPHQIREGLRQVCELTAEVTNMRIETLSKLEAVDQRLELNNMLSQFHQALMMGDDIAAVLRLRLPEFLQGVQGRHAGRARQLAGLRRRPGAAPVSAQHMVAEVLARLDQSARAPGVLMWDDLLTSDQRMLASLPQAAGMLLAHRFEDHTIFCFVTRPEVVQQVRWAGQPLKELAALPDGQVRLEPRRSFAEWQQQVQGPLRAVGARSKRRRCSRCCRSSARSTSCASTARCTKSCTGAPTMTS